VDERATGPQPAPAEPVEPAPERGRRLALSTAFFSAATGLSRIAGLVREIVAASYFGVTGAMSAFTIAFQVPNLMRALFADAALQGAFVPVFTELLDAGVPEAKVAQAMKMPPWAAKRALAQAKKADREALARALCAFADLEIELRGGGAGLDEDTAFSLTLTRAAAA